MDASTGDSRSSTTGWAARLRGAMAERRSQVVRLARYSATSILAFGVSEATLLILYGSGLLNATAAALVANLAATIPSYLMSRYWIWKEAPRARVARQVVLYWTTSIVCIVSTSLLTGAIARIVPADHPFHLAIVGVGFLLVSVVFWLGKFAVYHWVIFPTKDAVPATTGGSPVPSHAVRQEPRAGFGPPPTRPNS